MTIALQRRFALLRRFDYESDVLSITTTFCDDALFLSAGEASFECACGENYRRRSFGADGS